MPAGLSVSERIKSIVGQIEHESIADIGCDHGLISIFAIETGKAKKSIACDLNTGPIQRAESNIGRYGALEIEIRQGYGMDMLKPGEAETIVIAGMGGMLIIEILGKAAGTLESVSQLVLQPQHDVPEVRRYLHRAGFKIENEMMLHEDGKYYNIINCLKGVDSDYTPADYLFGKILIKRRDRVLWDYVKAQIKILRTVRDGITSGGSLTESAAGRLTEIDSLLGMYEELIACR